jgi:hypothetical protein
VDINKNNIIPHGQFGFILMLIKINSHGQFGFIKMQIKINSHGHFGFNNNNFTIQWLK